MQDYDLSGRVLMAKNDDPTRVSDGSSRVETFPKDMSNHAGNRKI